jgi:hypothetical protein
MLVPLAPLATTPRLVFVSPVPLKLFATVLLMILPKLVLEPTTTNTSVPIATPATFPLLVFAKSVYQELTLTTVPYLLASLVCTKTIV